MKEEVYACMMFACALVNEACSLIVYTLSNSYIMAARVLSNLTTRARSARVR